MSFLSVWNKNPDTDHAVKVNEETENDTIPRSFDNEKPVKIALDVEVKTNINTTTSTSKMNLSNIAPPPGIELENRSDRANSVSVYQQPKNNVQGVQQQSNNIQQEQPQGQQHQVQYVSQYQSGVNSGTNGLEFLMVDARVRDQALKNQVKVFYEGLGHVLKENNKLREQVGIQEVEINNLKGLVADLKAEKGLLSGKVEKRATVSNVPVNDALAEIGFSPLVSSENDTDVSTSDHASTGVIDSNDQLNSGVSLAGSIFSNDGQMENDWRDQEISKLREINLHLQNMVQLQKQKQGTSSSTHGSAGSTTGGSGYSDTGAISNSSAGVDNLGSAGDSTNAGSQGQGNVDVESPAGVNVSTVVNVPNQKQSRQSAAIPPAYLSALNVVDVNRSHSAGLALVHANSATNSAGNGNIIKLKQAQTASAIFAQQQNRVSNSNVNTILQSSTSATTANGNVGNISVQLPPGIATATPQQLQQLQYQNQWQ